MTIDETIQFEILAGGFQFLEAPRIDDDGTVYFSDLTAGGFYRLRPDRGVDTLLANRMWIGGAVLDQSGSILVSGKGGVARVDPATGASVPILSEIDGRPIIAVNDMEADSRGGIFAGTIDFEAVFERGEAPSGGRLFYIPTDGGIRILREGLSASNGMGLSPDGGRLYHSESTQGIWTYALGVDGMPGPAEMFASLPDSDGLAIDREGGVWVACWQSAQILRFTPDGVLDRRITLPFPHIVSLCFGGTDLSDLYVTTGGNAEHPGRGAVVRIQSPVPGLRPYKSRL